MQKNNKCTLCPRNCNVDRNSNIGYCGTKEKAVISKTMLHQWEEPCISYKNGSGTIFFSGCSLGCIFCQNKAISRNISGTEYSATALAELFKELESMGADNINLVTPTHFAKQIIEALNIYRPNIPIVYNSSGYESVETLKMLESYIDIYLIDFKYYDTNLAKIYSKAEDYPNIAKNAILECLRQKPNSTLDNGKMLSGVIIRHLLLPQATQNAIDVTNWVADNADNAYFSLMSQYIPCGENLPKPLQRKITRREYEKVVDHIVNLGLENVFLQDIASASKSYIPDF